MPTVDGGSIANNTTLDAVLGSDHTALKILLLLYNLLVIVMGLGGNVLVLVGSLKYRAVQMDRNSVILLENIAVADLVATVLQYVPMGVTLAAERWLFGEFLCFCAVFRYIPFAAEVMLIAIMSCHRVRVLRSPLKGSLDADLLKRVLVGVWVFYLVSVPCITGIKPVIKYTPSHLHCSSFDWENMAVVPSYLRIMRLVSGLYLALPTLITIVCNVLILRLVFSAPDLTNNNNNSKAVRTVSLICWIFVASYIPTVVIFALPAVGMSDIPHWVNCMSMYSVSLNLIANPVIYSFTNRRFAMFAKYFFTGRVKEFGRDNKSHS